MVPSVREPSPPPVLKPTPPTPQPTPSSSSTVPKPAVVVGGDKNVITLEFQRQRAKELQDYFKQKKLEEADQGPPFGFIGKNEITNGRYKAFLLLCLCQLLHYLFQFHCITMLVRITQLI